jgi:hypothetical protein
MPIMKNKSWIHFYVAGFALLLAMVQLHHLLLFFSATLGANMDAAIGVTTGHPHWRVYQNRILGPYLLKGLAGLMSGDTTGAYLMMLTVSLSLAGYQAWRVGRMIGGEQTGWFALVTLHLLFAFLFSSTWLYIWDFIGLNIFLAFVGFVISARAWYWFAALFAVAILNRESGQFIALWMILDPLSRRLVQRQRTKQADWRMAVAGVICAAAGAWLVGYLRTALLVEEVGFNLIHGTPPGYGPNYFWGLPSNLDNLQYAWENGMNSILTVSLSLMLISAIIALAVVLVLKDAARYLAFSITMLASAVSIMLFAYISETRVFVETIPFLLMGACLLFHSRRAAG